MEFDRTGLEGGLEIYSNVTEGKALLEFKVHVKKAVVEEMMEQAPQISLAQAGGTYLDIRIWDRDGALVFCSRCPLWQEELIRGIILHPHLWKGVDDPYCYRIQVSLMEKGDYVVDCLETFFALRSLQEVSLKGWFLNGKPFEIRAVKYVMPTVENMSCMVEVAEQRERIFQDLKLIRDMGANTICPVDGKIDREFCLLCDELGLVVWWSDSRLEEEVQLPCLYGGENSLLALYTRSFTDTYYFYKAKWCKTPFVFLSVRSLSFQSNGNVRVVVYSNQKKIALYVEGVLFEFRTQGPDFVFEDIPVKRLPLLLTAEAGECSMSVTAYPELAMCGKTKLYFKNKSDIL